MSCFISYACVSPSCEQQEISEKFKMKMHVSTGKSNKRPFSFQRVVIDNPKTEFALRNAIRNSSIYKFPEDFKLGRDTFFVESFNNTLNIYEDKRIAFGSDQYQVRADLGTCHWNENVGRPYTSVSVQRDPRAPRRQVRKENYVKKTFEFRQNIWNKYIKALFSKRNT